MASSTSSESQAGAPGVASSTTGTLPISESDTLVHSSVSSDTTTPGEQKAKTPMPPVREEETEDQADAYESQDKAPTPLLVTGTGETPDMSSVGTSKFSLVENVGAPSPPVTSQGSVFDLVTEAKSQDLHFPPLVQDDDDCKLVSEVINLADVKSSTLPDHEDVDSVLKRLTTAKASEPTPASEGQQEPPSINPISFVLSTERNKFESKGGSPKFPPVGSVGSNANPKKATSSGNREDDTHRRNAKERSGLMSRVAPRAQTPAGMRSFSDVRPPRGPPRSRDHTPLDPEVPKMITSKENGSAVPSPRMSGTWDQRPKKRGPHHPMHLLLHADVWTQHPRAQLTILMQAPSIKSQKVNLNNSGC